MQMNYISMLIAQIKELLVQTLDGEEMLKTFRIEKKKICSFYFLRVEVTKILIEFLEEEYGKTKGRVTGREKPNNNGNLLRTVVDNRAFFEKFHKLLVTITRFKGFDKNNNWKKDVTCVVMQMNYVSMLIAQIKELLVQTLDGEEMLKTFRIEKK
uniref:DUF4371 domain-containing protein n=1 Tax=Strongyloides papillosus TaxID=174720 RepID=A0A0N5BI26_STREA